MTRPAQLLNPLTVPYHRKVLRYAPLVLFPLWEPSGSQVTDLSGHGRHGAYTGVTFGQKKGRFVAPFFDGANDCADIYTTSLRDAFDGQEGSVVVWGKVYDVDVWTDGTQRNLLQLRVDVNNQISVFKASGANQLSLRYEANNTVETVTISSVTSIGWNCYGLTWSLSAGANGEVKAYENGAQTGSTQVSLGTWAGSLLSTRTLIGAATTTPGNVWHGWLAMGAVFDRALSGVAMAELAEA